MLVPHSRDNPLLARQVFVNENTRELVTLPGFARARYHSLLAETGGAVLRFREFVVFHGEYVYPCVPLLCLLD